ncbi:hypothetical protein EYF80_002885 [Liparis tanakae]|uniref:Uncharacterized protein n=1 Tax=Liparis tanakae TaxID=230148 RepID=A0A4Z2JBL9_9TELE|nr:hypothetical protein EYF80_002885 [Liparis tanakae]
MNQIPPVSAHPSAVSPSPQSPVGGNAAVTALVSSHPASCELCSSVVNRCIPYVQEKGCRTRAAFTANAPVQNISVIAGSLGEIPVIRPPSFLKLNHSFAAMHLRT